MAPVKAAVSVADVHRYTSHLQKGGALLSDMRLLVHSWSEDRDSKAAQPVVIENILGKRSRARAADTYRRAFLPRFVHGDPPDAWKIVQPLELKDFAPEIVRPVYYWVTARSEPILYDFAVEELAKRAAASHSALEVREVNDWISSKLRMNGQHWSESVTTRVARGMLAALRDFGVLKGRAKKQLASPFVPLESFAYLAFVFHKLGSSGERLAIHPDWRLFLLRATSVELLFLQAHQRHFLSYQAAGRIVRIEFPAGDYREMADVLTR
jgi:hypothetical protein